MFSQDRNQLRQMFFHTWQKQRNGEPLEPLESLIAAIIEQHPEYHHLLSDKEANLDKDFSVEMGQTNPFLHMAMHIAIQEQLGTQRPAGIVQLYQQLCHKAANPHDAEHQMMECLGEMMWHAQRNNQPPDENHYLTCLKKYL